jgi:peptide deformylase
MILKLIQAGDLVLRQQARELTPDQIHSTAVQGLIASMFETMYAAPGVGLAAPQVGLPLQIAVIEDRAAYIEKLPPEHSAERLRKPVAPHAIINPRITLEQSGTASFFEGCLSLPGFTAIVPRALKVRVDCLNEHAEPVTIHAEGWYARILQHEIDHLDGRLYIQRMLPHTFITATSAAQDWSKRSIQEAKRALGN